MAPSKAAEHVTSIRDIEIICQRSYSISEVCLCSFKHLRSGSDFQAVCCSSPISSNQPPFESPGYTSLAFGVKTASTCAQLSSPKESCHNSSHPFRKGFETKLINLAFQPIQSGVLDCLENGFASCSRRFAIIAETIVAPYLWKCNLNVKRISYTYLPGPTVMTCGIISADTN